MGNLFSIIIDDLHAIPGQFFLTGSEVHLNMQKLKDALLDGRDIPGCRLFIRPTPEEKNGPGFEAACKD